MVIIVSFSGNVILLGCVSATVIFLCALGYLRYLNTHLSELLSGSLSQKKPNKL